MDKETVLQKLKSEGFDVELLDMCVMLHIPEDCEDKDGLKVKFKARLNELGYTSSYEWRR